VQLATQMKVVKNAKSAKAKALLALNTAPGIPLGLLGCVEMCRASNRQVSGGAAAA